MPSPPNAHLTSDSFLEKNEWLFEPPAARRRGASDKVDGVELARECAAPELWNTVK